jgi:hypothetical protein
MCTAATGCQPNYSLIIIIIILIIIINNLGSNRKGVMRERK